MDAEGESMYRAVAARDRRFEGRFVVAVRTTGVYCRPGCPAPIPKAANVRFFACAAAAEEAGFRACLRCRPDALPGSPAWLGRSAVIVRALRLIEGGERDVGALAGRLGLGARQLRRLFVRELGAAPAAIMRTRRAHFARRLLEETTLPMAEVAFEAGFGSLRRFNAEMRDTFRRPPRALRREPRHPSARGLALKLPYRPPYDWEALLAFLAARATPGVERVEAGRYQRTVRAGGRAIAITLEPDDDGRHLVLRVPPLPAGALAPLVARATGLCDLSADPHAIAAVLGSDATLAPLVAARPGLRVPGAWDGFELAVRAVLGQQVSVKGATTLAGRLAAAHGEPVEDEGALDRLFPTAERLADADLSQLGLTTARRGTVQALARAVVDGQLRFDAGPEPLSAALAALPGIGPWTIGYLLMRLGEPDGWPTGDLGLRRALGDPPARAPGRTPGPTIDQRAEAWRPFRAYAAIHLWSKEMA